VRSVNPNRRTRLKTSYRLLLLSLTCLLPTLRLAAEETHPNYTPGQKIEYREAIGGKWEPGTFVGETPGGSQPIIRRKPSQFYPQGDQTAYAWADIRPAAPAKEPAPPAIPAPPAPPAIPPLPVPPPIPAFPVPPAPAPCPAVKPDPAKPLAPATAPAGAPLPEAEILDFLSGRLGTTPFADSAKLQQTKNDLGALIKARGTAFRHTSAISDFGQKISAFGMTSEVTGPLTHNFGAPNTQDWLFGSWVTSKTGLPVRYVEGDKLVTWLEIGAANTGTVSITKDGTYRWNTDSAQGVIEGKWHPASPAESGDHGGASVVLEKAKNGEDWHAFKYRAGNPGEEWLGLAEVNHRSIREGAHRIPPGQEGRIKIIPGQ